MKDPVVEQAKRDAQVGAETPERTPEKPGLHLSGGEVNNGPARTKPYIERQ
jgi:hypothetical protein